MNESILMNTYKKFTLAIITLISLSIVLVGCSSQASLPPDNTATSGTVHFEAVSAPWFSFMSIDFRDAGFEAAVRRQLAKPEGSITLSDVQTVTELSLTAEDDIANLSDISHFSELTSLHIQDLSFDNLEFLRHLPYIEYLTIERVEKSDGEVSLGDYSALSSLYFLEDLKISGIPFTDLSVLSDSALFRLFLYDTETVDLTPLAAMRYSLYELEITHSALTDIAPLATHKELSNLNITATAVSDLSVLSQLPSLVVLNISDTPVTDVSILQNLPALTSFTAEGCDI